MRVDRRKHIRKILLWYRMSFGFEPPYRILVDASLIQAALEGKVFLKEQLPKLTEHPTFIVITRCILADTRHRGPEYSGAAVIAKNLKFVTCGHQAPVASDQCMLSLVGKGNPERLLVGTQSVPLRRRMRAMGGIPLLYISHNTPVLESPSQESRDKHAKGEATKGAVTTSERKKVETELEAAAGEAITRKRKKFAKGPNPLAVKKKKALSESAPQMNQHSTDEEGAAAVHKRKRKRKRQKTGTSANQSAAEQPQESDS